MAQRGLKMVWSLLNQVLCVLYNHTFYFFPKRKAGKKGSISSFDKVFPLRKFVLSVSKIVGMSSDFQISVVKGFLEFHRPPPLQEMILAGSSPLSSWRLVCRGLAQSIKLPVVGILYLSSWNFAFVLLVFCILSSSPSWGRRPELCPLYLICKVDAQVMARDGAPRYIWMDNVTSTLCKLLWFDTYFISLRAT